MSNNEIVEIGSISNYYGGLCTKVEGGKYYWSIENHDGNDWEEIPKSLYGELILYGDGVGCRGKDDEDKV